MGAVVLLTYGVVIWSIAVVIGAILGLGVLRLIEVILRSEDR